MQNVNCKLQNANSVNSLATSHWPPATTSPAGVTLLEVLVSVFIISVGLLGVAALIPLGKLAISQTNIADRTGALGRSALRDVEVRRMLDYRYWYPASGNNAFIIDPLGYSSGLTGPLGLLRVNMRTTPDLTNPVVLSAAQADPIFRCADELIFTMPKDMNPPQQGDRPVPFMVGSNQQNEGNFSWFMTVCPSRSDIALNIPVAMRRDYDVSVVVCHKRDFTGAGEYSSAATFVGGVSFGGGTINVSTPAILEHIKTDQWVMLAANTGATAKWYRVVGVGNVGTPYISLVGPDWDTANYPMPTLIVVEGVTGVYTTTIHLDNDCTWTR